MPMGESVLQATEKARRSTGEGDKEHSCSRKQRPAKFGQVGLVKARQALSEESSNPEYDPLVEGESVGHI